MVTCTDHEGIAVVQMDDGKANTLNPASLQSFHAALDAALPARATVLQGRDGMFSAGLDLKVLPTLEREDFRAAIASFERLVRRLLEWPAPLVGAVAGHALAGGAVLLLTCDYALACSGPYKIGLNETAIGIPLPDYVINIARLKLSPRIHLRALVAGEAFGVEEAATIGYLDEVAAASVLLEKALERAALLAKVPAMAYSQTKIALRREVLNGTSTLGENLERIFTDGNLRSKIVK